MNPETVVVPKLTLSPTHIDFIPTNGVKLGSTVTRTESVPEHPVAVIV